MSSALAAIIGSAAGALALVVVIIFFIWFFVLKRKITRASQSGSSEPSTQDIERNTREIGPPLPSTLREARCFSLQELELATKNFNEINPIGEGSFGPVYKGLLHDGMVVAIKRRPGAPRQEFIDEVQFLSRIQHRNLVTLLGYCQENEHQMLLYEYIPNGSVSNHIYGQCSTTKLEFKNRLLIAMGAAKGLAHLHSLVPPVLHKAFKTANVLVDENFIPRVADAGLHNLLERINTYAGPACQMMKSSVFLDPEVRYSGKFSENSDVYSFGMFLLELLSGRSAESDRGLIEQARNLQDFNDTAAIIDEKLGGSCTAEGVKEFMELVVCCIHSSGQRRPTMKMVASELERIYEKEISLTTVVGEGTATVTLASQLFTT